MPNIKSAIKRMRSDSKKASRNNTVVSEIKTLDQRLRKLENDLEKAQTTAKRLFSRLDSAVSKGAIPRGRADRKKSRIAKYLKKIKATK